MFPEAKIQANTRNPKFPTNSLLEDNPKPTPTHFHLHSNSRSSGSRNCKQRSRRGSRSGSSHSSSSSGIHPGLRIIIIVVTGHLDKRHGEPGVPIDVEVDCVDGVAPSRDWRLLRRGGDVDIMGVDVCVSVSLEGCHGC